jgi:hypothetical protein
MMCGNTTGPLSFVPDNFVVSAARARHAQESPAGARPARPDRLACAAKADVAYCSIGQAAGTARCRGLPIRVLRR